MNGAKVKSHGEKPFLLTLQHLSWPLVEAFFVASLLVRDTGIGQSFDESGSKIRIQHFSFSSEDPE